MSAFSKAKFGVVCISISTSTYCISVVVWCKRSDDLLIYFMERAIHHSTLPIPDNDTTTGALQMSFNEHRGTIVNTTMS